MKKEEMQEKGEKTKFLIFHFCDFIFSSFCFFHPRCKQNFVVVFVSFFLELESIETRKFKIVKFRRCFRVVFSWARIDRNAIFFSVPGGWTSPPLCELRTSLPTDIFRHRVFRVIGLCTLGPHRSFPHSVRQTFQQFLQRCSYLCFLCYAKNSLLCFRPFPEVTLLARRRWRGAVMSFKKKEKKDRTEC